MPVHDGSRSEQDERLPPPGPERSQGNPEQFVQGSQSTARSLHVQSQQLPTESQVFEDEVLARAAWRTVGPERDPLMLFVGDAFVRFDFAQRIKMEPLVVRENSIQLFRPNATLLHSDRLASEASLPSS